MIAETAQVEVQKLRQQLHERVDKLADEDVEPAYRLLQEMEIKKMRESVGRAADQALAEGQGETVAGDVRKFRERHPYR